VTIAYKAFGLKWIPFLRFFHSALWITIFLCR